MFLALTYSGPQKKLFRSVWWLSSSAAAIFLLIFIAVLPDYGPRNLGAGLLGVAALILGLFVAAVATFLSFILTCFPDVSFAAKCSAWISVGLAWGTLVLLSQLR